MKKIVDTKRTVATYQFLPTGFHGDKHLIDLIDYLVSLQASTFIETGTNVSSTLHYFASKNLNMPCYSCEPDTKAFSIAKEHTKSQKNVNLYNQTSQEFIQTLEEEHPEVFEGKPIFWLDAHGYGFEWPIEEEIKFVSSKFEKCYVLIDDFKVPHLDVFGYDVYQDQVCSYDYIKKYFSHHNYQLIYPNYTEKTSKHHPLRGWGLFVFGEQLKFPEEIQKYIKFAH